MVDEKRGPALPALEGILLLEQPLLHAPYDELRRQLRSHQRLAEHEFRHAHHALAPLRPPKHKTSLPVPATSKYARHHGPDQVPSTDVSMSFDPADEGPPADARAAAAAAAEHRMLMARARAEVETQTQQAAGDLNLTSEVQAAAAASVSVRSTLNRLKELRNKLGSLGTQFTSTVDSAQARVGHLNELHQTLARAPTSSSVVVPAARGPAIGAPNDDREGNDPGEAFERWTTQRLDRMLVDYLLRHRWPRTAAKLAESHHLEPLVDTALFAEIDAVERTMSYDETGTPECKLALAWCSENKAALKKAKSTLEFELRLQEYIELVRVRTPASLQSAIQYARKHLVAYAVTSSAPAEDEVDIAIAIRLHRTVFRALGLLACDPNSNAALYPDLATPSRWTELRTKFRSTALEIHSLPAQPTLHLALSAGLSALKLPDCYASLDPTTLPPADTGTRRAGGAGGSAGKNPDCPICDTDRLGQLAKEVPWSHHVNSTLMCRITGRVMNDDDPPLALPNGQVYSASGLAELESTSPVRGQITDPATGDKFTLSAARKMFVS